MCNKCLKYSVPPKIYMMNPKDETITVRAGSTVRLKCKATGQPKPDVYWSRQVR